MVHDTVSIKPYDSVHIKVECERGIAKELSEFFTFSVPNYKFTPAYKNKLWDGQIRLYNVHTQTIYAGLKDYVIHFAEERGYAAEINIEDSSNNVNMTQVGQYLNEHLHLPFEPYEHQLTAITHSINNNRCLLLSPTGSGKSLMIYSLIRYYQDIMNDDKKILVVVPTTGLVSQMFSDFTDYSKKSKWNVDKNCHRIFAGQEKETDKKIVISTWQSLHKMPEKYFSQFGAVFGDECHLFKAKSLTNIMSKLKDCPYRIGTTGTLDGSITHKLVIEGLFGRVFKVTSTKKLMEEELLSNLSIDCITLKYSEEEVQQVKRVKYQEEIKWIVKNPKRNKFIVDLACNLEGNTLLLFNFVKEHGIPLYESIKNNCSGKKVFLIHGGTDINQREKIRKIVNEEQNAILIASYGTCSTGINIKNIHNIIFASPSRSVIRVLQSIGRGLRRSENKDKVKLYDISDDLRYLKYINHTYRHLNERIKIYSNERFEFNNIDIRI